MRWGSVLVGALGLALLDALVSSSRSASNAGGFIAGLGSLVEKFISPSVPAFSVPATTSSAVAAAPAAANAPAPLGQFGGGVTVFT